MTQPTAAIYLSFVAALARAVELLRRSNEAGEPQKAALRALVAMAAERSATLRLYEGSLTVDGTPVPMGDPRLANFIDRLAAQSVAEIVIARGAEPMELLALAIGLAADGGHGRIKERLRDASSTKVMVVVHSMDSSHRAATVSGAFAKLHTDAEVLAEWNKFLNHGGSQGRTDHQVDIGLPAQQIGEIQIDMREPPERPAERPAAAAAPAPPPPVPAPVAATPTLQAASPLGIALAHTLSDPYGKDTLSRLTPLARGIEDAFSRGSVPEGIDAANTLIELETNAPSKEIRNTFGVIIGRILTRATLAKVTPFLQEPRRRNRATVVLRRGGEVSAELLTTLISGAQSLGERVVYVTVLREIPQGTDRLMPMLSDRVEWLVARNVAELMGEACIDAAVPYLARLVAGEGGDERVRRVALVAMAKIGGAGAIEPLRAVLKSGAPELKSLVAANIGGARARPLTAPLATAAEGEDNPDVARALVKALARIGTPEARQALERMSGQKTLFSRRGKVLREAAEDALRSFVVAPVS